MTKRSGTQRVIQFSFACDKALRYVVDQVAYLFVTFAKSRDRLAGATYLRIPWTTRLTNPDWLVGFQFAAGNTVMVKERGWGEDVFWGRRYVVKSGFGVVTRLSLYPLYFGLRDHVVQLGTDFSMVRINFTDQRHLKIDQISPAAADRAPSESNPNTATLSLTLLPSIGTSPQVLKAEFNYFLGLMAWRPILISFLFLVLGNLTGPVLVPLVRKLLAAARARIELAPSADGPQERQRGVILSTTALSGITPGETTYDEVVRRCGRGYA